MGPGSEWTPGRARSDGGKAWGDGGKARDNGGKARDGGGEVRDNGGEARDDVYSPRMAEITPGKKGGFAICLFFGRVYIVYR